MTKRRSWVVAATAISLLLTVAGTALGAEGVKSTEPVTPAVRADGMISVEGTLEYVDLEGGFYSVGGWGLIGDTKLYSALQGQSVIVTGKEFTGISFRMVRQIEVDVVGLQVTSARTLPTAVTVHGKAVSFDQGPVVENGVLMLPLRRIVEAAGGSVEWVHETRTVLVTMPDRKAVFVIGEGKAEMNENGVFYFARNMLAMEQAPILRNGRTLISADAVSRILGLTEQAGFDGSLDLVKQ